MKGEDQGAYYHAKFMKEKPEIVSEIRRLPVKPYPHVTEKPDPRIIKQEPMLFLQQKVASFQTNDVRKQIVSKPEKVEMDNVLKPQRERDSSGSSVFDATMHLRLPEPSILGQEPSVMFEGGIEWGLSSEQFSEDVFDVDILDSLFDDNFPVS
jgi:hypothetical protein